MTPSPTPRPRTLSQLVAAAAKSQLRRYPAQIAESLRARAKPGAHEIREAPVAAAGFGWPEGADPAALAAVWLGHATVLLRVGGVTVLTDPVFSERIGMRLAGRTVGVARRTVAPVPPIQRPDVVLISHAHFDHLDRPSLRALAHEATTVITARGTRRLIPRGFGRVIELDWHESVVHAGLTFAAYRPRHWGARTLWDRHRGYNSYLIEARPSRPGPSPGPGADRVFFAGDTAFTHAFDAIEADLAIFGIGAYEPWIHAHANPEQVWAMFRAMRAGWLLPIHHQTFQLGDEAPDEPLERLLKAAGPDQLRVVGQEAGSVFVRGPL